MGLVVTLLPNQLPANLHHERQQKMAPIHESLGLATAKAGPGTAPESATRVAGAKILGRLLLGCIGRN